MSEPPADSPALPVATTGEDALAVAERLVREAGALVAGLAGRSPVMQQKGLGDLVTAADHASEELVLAGLAAAFPDHAQLAEESRPDTDWRSGYVWLLDPIDGTRNFSQGIPLYCVTLGLALDGVPLLGVTYAPALEWCAVGGPGLGLRVNGEPARASQAEGLESAVAVLDIGYDVDRGQRLLEEAIRIRGEVGGLRLIGSAALSLAWAATGLIDLLVHVNLYPWDLAALALIEAGGGIALDRDGGPATFGSEGVVVGAPGIVEEFLARVEGRRWR